MSIITIIVLLVCFLSQRLVEGLEPALIDVTAIKCPKEKPYICLPYGGCCRGDEFCFQGSCESCFFKMPEDELLSWCQQQGLYNVTVMRHDSCALACYARFGAAVLVRDKGEIVLLGNTEVIVVISVLILIILFLLTVAISLCCCKVLLHKCAQPVMETLKKANFIAEQHTVEMIYPMTSATVNLGLRNQMAKEESRQSAQPNHIDDVDNKTPLLQGEIYQTRV